MPYEEWKNSINPFQSLKALFWHDELLAMSRGETPTPICATIDATNACNCSCSFCIMSKLRADNPVAIPDYILLQIPTFLKTWGVKSVCVGGGGEPFCHPKIAELFLTLHRVGMPAGTITNGIALDNPQSRDAVLQACRWIGVSIDAATKETYNRIKRPDCEDALKKVCENISWIAANQTNNRPQIGAKFVIHHHNYKEIYEFAKLAREIGADDVHFRPVYIEGYNFPEGVVEAAQEQITRAREDFEEENFHVYGIVHKFEKNWKRKIAFKKCRATSINAYFLASGKISLCCDRRGDENLNLGPYYPFSNVLEKWGSPEHKAMLEKINPEFCPRCTQSGVNEIIEKGIIEDKFCLEFV